MRKCPEHIGTGVTPTDEFCHNHESDVQQLFHNFHCRCLDCPYALQGVERHNNVPSLVPRNGVEEILRMSDQIYDRINKLFRK